MVVFVDHERTGSDLHSSAKIGALVKEAEALHLDYANNHDNRLFLGPPATGNDTTKATAANGSVGHASEDASRASNSGSENKANLNTDHGFSTALRCYPVVKEIARSVDLNTLDALSRVCREFRANLLQFRNQLVRETLRCRNESLDDYSRAETEASFLSRNNERSFVLSSSSLPGKVSRCARDMVGECQRCARVVCRNCTTKQPSTDMFKNRLRRLCHTCLEVPLSRHLSSNVSTSNQDPPVETWGAGGLCSCETNVWLCRPCAHILRSDDVSYMRVWSWRTRHNAFPGDGLATGIVECHGVKCGRQDWCLAAKDIEVEVDCDVDDWAWNHSAAHGVSGDHRHSHNHNHNNNVSCQRHHGDGHGDEEPGYLRQEIEGIGGIVKQKVKKRIMVGASVDQSDREQEKGVDLEEETSGAVRSWCAWCSQVVPSKAETAEM